MSGYELNELIGFAFGSKKCEFRERVERLGHDGWENERGDSGDDADIELPSWNRRN